jgi:HlyD family secretion protein
LSGNVTATGSISALTTVQVGTQVSGIIAKLYADFNTVVKKGQVVALLDTTILSASKDDAEAMAQKSKVLLKEMKIEFDRSKKLFEENAVSKSEYDLALTNYESAQSTVSSTEAQLKRAKINRQYATIIAPISGIVISRNVDVGQTVVSSFNSPTLFTIANDLKKMQVYANVDEADIGQVKLGQKVIFTVDAYPEETFSGEVDQIRLQPVLIQNVVNYIVIINVENPELKLLPGLTANITFKIKEHENVLKIATTALRFMPSADYLQKNLISDTLMQNIKKSQKLTYVLGSSAYIWLKQGVKIIPKYVTIGLMEGGFVEISGDIKEGDEVILRSNSEESSSVAKSPFMPSFKPSQRRQM